MHHGIYLAGLKDILILLNKNKKKETIDMEKNVIRPNSAYYFVCCAIMLSIPIFTFVGVIISFDEGTTLGNVFFITMGFVSLLPIYIVSNLKFIFYDDHVIVPNGTYGDKLKKKDRTIYYSKITNIYYIDTSKAIPHIIIECGRKKIHVNTVLFSNKRALEIETMIKKKTNIID